MNRSLATVLALLFLAPSACDQAQPGSSLIPAPGPGTPASSELKLDVHHATLTTPAGRGPNSTVQPTAETAHELVPKVPATPNVALNRTPDLSKSAGQESQQTQTTAISPPVVRLECSSARLSRGQPLSCGFRFTGQMIQATWYAPAGSPSRHTGGSFTTVFQDAGPATVSLEVCGPGGCVTKTYQVEVHESPRAHQSEPTRQQQDRPEATSGRWDGLFSLPPCDESTQLTIPPLDWDGYQVIVPLGLLSPPRHVFPTSHIYYHLKGQNRDEGVSPTSNPPKVVDIRAPGNIRILGISYTIAHKNGELWYTDYDLIFAPCQDRLFELIHVSTLNPELRDLQDVTEPSQCDNYGSDEFRYTYCQAAVQVDIKAGTILGTAGGQVSVALDLEAYDLASPPLAFANPSRYRSDLDLRLHVVCPFDGFTVQAKLEQLARMGSYDGQPRTVEPLCGQVMQDVPGTAQGNWFNGDSGARVPWDKELALVHDHVDPTQSAISVGGTVMDMGLWLFDSQIQGLVNREFSQVLPDGRIYCYQGGVSSEGGEEPKVFPGRLLLKLETSTEMLVEQQDGSCQENLAFVEPTKYQR